jgi:hypothetical protein
MDFMEIIPKIVAMMAKMFYPLAHLRRLRILLKCR